MSHFSAPSHPLIHSFLLEKEEFFDTKKIIVENPEKGEKLLQNLRQLAVIQNTKKTYKLISTPRDILEVEYSDDMIGIFPIETLDWKVDHPEQLLLTLVRGEKYSEDVLVTWLTDHGYSANQSTEEYTFFRQGDTVSVHTRQGLVLINFFGNTVETIYLNGVEQNQWRFFAV